MISHTGTDITAYLGDFFVHLYTNNGLQEIEKGFEFITKSAQFPTSFREGHY